MAKTQKRTTDINQRAKSIVDLATGQSSAKASPKTKKTGRKTPPLSSSKHNPKK